MRSLVVIGVLAGCGRAHFDPRVGDAVTGDDAAAVDDATGAPDGLILADAPACVGTGFYTLCPAQPIAPVVMLDTSTIDTDTSPLCGGYTGTSDALCVIAADSVEVIGAVGATGARPLVLLGMSTLAIAGTIDVASHRGGLAGPGSAALCSANEVAMNKFGGPGGSFGGRGGAGGGGVSAGATLAPTTLRGGCRGADGSGSTQGRGGIGGGAIYLVAGQKVTVAGTINASGAGGTGAFDTAGGGGGGSGGMIVLDAPAISVAGQVFANGGGGGEGAGNSNSGNPGADPSAPLVRAAGGSGGAGAGDGGAGAAAANLDGSNGALSGSAEGGGGGGGAGVIRVFPPRPLIGAISPTPS